MIPSGDVITPLPVLDDPTATNKLRSEDQHTAYHGFVVGVARAVQVKPSGDDITEFVTLLLDTATNKLRSADQHTLYHFVSAGVV